MSELNNYVLYVLLGLLMLYLIFIIIGTNKTIEGITNKDSKSIDIMEDVATDLKKQSQKAMDGLNLEKYKNDYIDACTELEEMLNLVIIAKIFGSPGSSIMDSIDKNAESINSLYKLRDNLSSSVDYINTTDGSKTTTATAKSKISSFFG